MLPVYIELKCLPYIRLYAFPAGSNHYTIYASNLSRTVNRFQTRHQKSHQAEAEAENRVSMPSDHTTSQIQKPPQGLRKGTCWVARHGRGHPKTSPGSGGCGARGSGEKHALAWARAGWLAPLAGHPGGNGPRVTGLGPGDTPEVRAWPGPYALAVVSRTYPT